MKLSFVGDVQFRQNDPMTAQRAQWILEETKETLQAADFRIVNLETPLADKEQYAPIPKSGPNHCYSPACVSFLTEMRADVAVLANNHMGDYGPGALRDTVRLLEEKGVRHVGAGENIDAAYQAVYLEKEGLTVALLAVCENEFGLADENRCGTAAYRPGKLLRAIQREKQAAGKVIVIFHGGNEFNPLPSPGAAARYRMICDMGADAVIAMHPHCPQGFEMYGGKPIVYSLGNFLFQSRLPRRGDDSWYYGYMAALDIRPDGEISLEITPYRFDTTSRIHVFSGDERAAMMVYLNRISDIIRDGEELRRCYMGWCSLHPWFVSPPPQYGGMKNQLAGQINLVTCEAHAEMLRENYRILNDGEEESARAYAEKITALSKMPV